jgi:ribosomal protein S18 acetylase RimI-like enzyme
MPRLSNLFRSQNVPVGHSCTCRPAAKEEIDSALRLILANDQGPAGDEPVLDFLSFALQRKIDLNQIWIAEVERRIVWALLPITSPGRTMLLITPARIQTENSIDAARMLVEQMCAHWRQNEMHLAQFLLDPQDSAICDLYSSCGFEILAELLYLQKFVANAVDPDLPAGFELLNYSDQTHGLFAETILRSYEASLDCPALNGRRNVEDIIAGHKSAGIFDPNLWYLLRESGQPRGVLILSPSPHNESVELVYLGLTPQGRHRGLSDALMRVAMGSVARLQRSDLSLAVDSRNIPALRLYYRHGMQRIGSRIAMVRDLRELPANSAAGI